MRDARGGYQVQHAFEEPHPGTQDRRKHKLLARKHLGLRWHHGSLDLYRVKREVSSDLITQQRGDLAQQLTKPIRRSGLVTHMCELVLHQGMIHRRYAFHQNTVPSLKMWNAGPPSARFCRAMSRPAAQVPPSSGLAS